MRFVVAFATGVVFAVGLGVAGMLQPQKIVAFLDVAGAWDPSLAFVMMGAIPVMALAYRVGARRQRPLFGASFPAAQGSGIDARLVGGAAIFGVGWALSGYCPGPGLVSVATATAAPALFVASMVAGMWLHDLVVARSDPAALDRPAGCGD